MRVPKLACEAWYLSSPKHVHLEFYVRCLCVVTSLLNNETLLGGLFHHDGSQSSSGFCGRDGGYFTLISFLSLNLVSNAAFGYTRFFTLIFLLQIESGGFHHSPLRRPYRAHVLRHFPETCPWNAPFDPAAVVMFCFPRGLRFKSSSEDRRVKFHSFVMTKVYSYTNGELELDAYADP